MASASLLKHFVKDYHAGITVTLPGLLRTTGRVLRLGLAYPKLVDLLTTFHFGQHRISNFEMKALQFKGWEKCLA